MGQHTPSLTMDVRLCCEGTIDVPTLHVFTIRHHATHDDERKIEVIYSKICLCTP